MSVASPPTGFSNRALIRWAFEILNMLPPDGSAGDRATKAAFNAKTRLLARLRGRRRR